MESAYFDEPPSYAGPAYSRSTTVSPSYSPSPRPSELVIRSSSDASCAAPQDYVYRSKLIIVNLGPKTWGMSFPVYGSGASVEGTFSLSGDLKNVSSVSIKLEGSVKNMHKYTERRLVARVDVLSMSSSYTAPISGDWTQDQPFSHPLPSFATGRQTPLPPSSLLYHSGVICYIKYRLRITVIRKGLRRNDSLKIPFLYLPRTFARGPLIPCIPNTVINLNGPSFAQGLKEVKIVQLRASSKHATLDTSPVITLALPSVLSFAAYDAIPMTLNIVCPHSVVVAKLLLSAAKIQLIRRTRTWINGGRTSRKHESLAGVADIINTDEGPDGVSVVSYELHTTRATVQKSWAVDGVAEQQYYIQVTVRPPSSTAGHIPNYDCEQPIELTTDSFDSSEREIAALGGSPSPAIEPSQHCQQSARMAEWPESKENILCLRLSAANLR